MSKREIIDAAARAQLVEGIVRRVTKTSTLGADMSDLCQMIYVALLDKPEEVIVRLWKHNQLNYYVAKMVMTQIASSTSPYRLRIASRIGTPEGLTSL